eukprot:m.175096 g.175096  ORF g.175096 m.175096 type:complete len:304 (-) comp31799_c0_seq1:49-960(-)
MACFRIVSRMGLGAVVRTAAIVKPTFAVVAPRTTSTIRHLATVAELPRLTYTLSEEQINSWDRDGMLILSDVLPQQWIDELPSMAQELADLEEDTGAHLKHYELTDSGTKQICRVENFCKTVPRWKELCLGLVQDIVGQAVRSPSVLFKDKINYKGPHGAGFLCHQDASAYGTDELAARHVSVLVAVDAATKENGCLQVAPGTHNSGLFKNAKGVIDPEVENSMEFVNVTLNPGQLVLFDSFLPHRSESNNTDGWRRSGYLTFNKLNEGDHHTAYYEKKAKVFADGTGGPISINDDFAGNIVK